MLITNLDSICGDRLLLGVQTNRENVYNAIDKQCRSWAPAKARSFKYTVKHTDYNGREILVGDEVTGYARIEVFYYTRRNEGDYQLFSCNGLT